MIGIWLSRGAPAGSERKAQCSTTPHHTPPHRATPCTTTYHTTPPNTTTPAQNTTPTHPTPSYHPTIGLQMDPCEHAHEWTRLFVRTNEHIDVKTTMCACYFAVSKSIPISSHTVCAFYEKISSRNSIAYNSEGIMASLNCTLPIWRKQLYTCEPCHQPIHVQMYVQHRFGDSILGGSQYFP